MVIILCSCICCLLIYVIFIVKTSTKQIVNESHRSLQNQFSVYSKTAMTLSNDKPSINIELPPLQNPASDSCSNYPNKVDDDDKIVINDWKLTVNDLHRFPPIPPSSISKNQPSTGEPDTPIPREVHEIGETLEFEIKLDGHDEIEQEEDETSIDDLPDLCESTTNHVNHIKINKSLTVNKAQRNIRNDTFDTMIEHSPSWKGFSVKLILMEHIRIFLSLCILST